MEPFICFGQQPNGILPKRYFVAKLEKARELKKEIGGRIVWFLHDSDHDYRETRMLIPDENNPDGYSDFNFDFKNKTQRKWTPLALKEYEEDEMEAIRTALHHLTNDKVVEAFDNVKAKTVSEFCVEMYKELGLLDDVEIVSSYSDDFRSNARLEGFPKDYFYDAEYEGEVVRAEIHGKELKIHHGGPKYTKVAEMTREEMLQHPGNVSAGRDPRFDWMQSVIKCTHYVMGNSEAEYLEEVDIEDKPELVLRKQVDNAELAWWPRRG